MLQIGDFNRLKVAREVDFGIYLESEDGDLLMPGKYVPEGTKPGDIIDAFVYRDSEDRLIATTLVPKVKVNEFAVLQVIDESQHGSFLDWGLEKDLFVPYTQQKDRMATGDWHPIYVYLDDTTDRLVATAKLGRFLKNEQIQLKEGDKVNLLVINQTDLGYKVIIDNRYIGILYANEVFRPVVIGEKTTGFIKKIRPDNKIDVSLQQTGYDEVLTAREKVLEELHNNNGTLALSDNSDPEEIKKQLGLSKKLFKKAIGGLYREGLVELLPEQTVLIRKK